MTIDEITKFFKEIKLRDKELINKLYNNGQKN